MPEGNPTIEAAHALTQGTPPPCEKSLAQIARELERKKAKKRQRWQKRGQGSALVTPAVAYSEE